MLKLVKESYNLMGEFFLGKSKREKSVKNAREELISANQ